MQGAEEKARERTATYVTEADDESNAADCLLLHADIKTRKNG